MNKMIINNKIFKIIDLEIDNTSIYFNEESNKFSFHIYFGNLYNFDNLVVNKEKDCNFSEYTISENNEESLIFPKISKIKKLKSNEYYIYLKFENLETNDKNNIVYMNRKGKYDLDNIEIELTFNLKKK